DPSALNDSTRPAQSPLASFLIDALATSTRNAAPRPRTLAPRTMACASGVHAYCPIAPWNVPVSLRGSPPSAGTTQSFSSARSHVVLVGARYESSLPFGDHWTFCSGAL